MRPALPKFFPKLLIAALAAGLLSACGINSVPTAEENAKARWADVEAAYQRRADLIPNLIETVKGYMGHERGFWRPHEFQLLSP